MTAFLVLSLPWVLELSPVMRLCLRLAVVTTLQPIMEYITTSDTIGTTKNTIEENSYSSGGMSSMAQKAEEATSSLEYGSLNRLQADVLCYSTSNIGSAGQLSISLLSIN